MSREHEPNIRDLTITFAKGLLPNVMEWNPDLRQMVINFYTDTLIDLMNTRLPEIRSAKDAELAWEDAGDDASEPDASGCDSYEDLAFSLASDILDMYYDCDNIPEKVLEYDEHTLYIFLEYVKDCVHAW